MNIYRVATWVIVAAGVALRLTRMEASSIWFDEAFELALLELPLFQMVSLAAEDFTPPGWFILQWPFIHFLGTSLWTLRLPSALASIGTLVLVGPVASEMSKRQMAGLLATAFVAIAPYQLWMAHDARVYAWLTFVAVLALWQGLAGRWWGFSAALGIGLWSSAFSAFYWPAVVLAVCQHHRWQWPRVRSAALASAVAIVSYLPWLPTMIGRATEGEYWLSQQSQIITEVLFIVSVVWFSNATVFVALAGAISLGLAVVVGLISTRHNALLWLLPLGLMFAVAWLVHPVIYYRSLSVMAVLMAIWLAGALVRRAWHTQYALLVLVVTLGIGVVSYDPAIKGGFYNLPESPVWVHATATTLLPIRYHQPDSEHYLVMSDSNPRYWTAESILDAAGVIRVERVPCPALFAISDDVYLFDAPRARLIQGQPITTITGWQIPAIRIYALEVCDP